MGNWKIENKEEWLGSPANIKGANKDAKIQVGWSMTLRNLLFCAHTLCMSYVTQCGVNNYCVLCTVKAKKTEQKPTTENFVGFHNHTYLLTMVKNSMNRVSVVW